MIRCYQMCEGVPRFTGDAEAAPCAGGLVWCHVNGQEAEALAWLDARADIPPVALSALKARETRPRTARIEDGALINLRGPGETPEDDPDDLVSVRIWAQEGRVISLGYNLPLAVDAVAALFMEGRILDPGDLVTAFARVVTQSLDEDMVQLGDTLDAIELRIELEKARSTRRKVNAVRAQAIRFRRFVVPQRDALERLAETRLPWLDAQDLLHLQEVADRFARLAEELESVRERAAVVHDELTDMRSELVESRALLLSIVALIFMPLTFISGLLGMNVKGIPYAEEPWAFWGVVAFCVIVGLIVLTWFVAAHWLRLSRSREEE